LAERRHIAIWMDLLKQQQIRPDTSFIELGGDAQTVNALKSRISEDFGKQLTIVQLPENPTVSK
jgi:hypothetical protein